MSDQVKFVGVHRERENGGEGLYNSWEYIDREKERERRMGGYIYMSDQVKFVGVHRERERRRKGDGLYIMLDQVKFVEVHIEKEKNRERERERE